MEFDEMTKYKELQEQLEELPHISPHQVHQWVNLQETIDKSKDYLVMAVPEAQASVDQARRILEQKTWTLVFFGGTGVHINFARDIFHLRMILIHNLFHFDVETSGITFRQLGNLSFRLWIVQTD